MSQITHNIYLGNFPNLYNTPWFYKKNIKVVIDLIQYSDSRNINPMSLNPHIQYHHFPLKDTPSENLFKYYPKINKVIEEATKRGENIYIHCVVGMSRSPSIVIAYLMHKYRRTLSEVNKFVKEKRSIVRPNSGFIHQLKNWERYLGI